METEQERQARKWANAPQNFPQYNPALTGNRPAGEGVGGDPWNTPANVTYLGGGSLYDSIQSQFPTKSASDIARITFQVETGVRTQADVDLWARHLNAGTQPTAAELRAAGTYDVSVYGQQPTASYLSNKQTEALLAAQANTLAMQQGLNESESRQNASDLAKSLFPWATDMGLMDMLSAQIMDGASAEQAYASLVKEPAYQRMFAGMTDPNGLRRFTNERQYLDTINDYKDVLKEFDAFDANTDINMGYVGFIDQGIDPNELRERFGKYREVEAGGQWLKDAYYVYGGMTVSTDDLYQAMVSPEFGNQLTSEYDRTVALSVFDYETYITRATEVGLTRAAEMLRGMQTRGMVTGQVVSRLLQTDPNFARTVMDALFQGNPSDTQTLGLDELLTAFDMAMLASAATEQGLELPTRERVDQLLKAGVSRSQALQSYGTFARNKNLIKGAGQRVNLGEDFVQNMWEDAILLGKGQGVQDLARLAAGESNFGRAQGGFAIDQEGSRITQRGRQGMV